MVLYLSALFIMIVALVLGLGMSWDRGNDRLKQLRERLELVEKAEKRESRVSLALIRDDLLSEIPALNRWLGEMGRGTALRGWLRQAAIETRPGKFLLTCVACGLGGGMLAILWMPWYGFVAIGLPSAALPYFYAKKRRAKRLQQFQNQFAEALELLSRASRAGHPPSAALELIATEMPEPVAGEFRQVFDQQRFGLPLRDCLLNLAERIPLTDVQFFATAMIVQRDSGGNLAEILDKLSFLIRERVKIGREVKTRTAQGRMTMIVLMVLPPAILGIMSLSARDLVMRMFTEPLGHVMLTAGLTLQFVGWLLLRRIVDIKV